MNDTNKLINVPIEFEIRLDFPGIKKGSGGAYVDCPFCGGHKKLFASFKKNVWRCNKCGEFGNAVTLHATMTGTDNKASYKDLQKRFEGLGADAMERLKPQSTGTEITPAPVSLRDYVYREMSNYLDISSKHLDDLHKRGLTDEMIEKLGIKTMPRSGLYSIAKKAIVMTGVAESMQKYHWQIPGFYGNGDVVRMVRRGNGILIPVITHERKIRVTKYAGMTFLKTPMKRRENDIRDICIFRQVRKMTAVDVQVLKTSIMSALILNQK